MEVNKLSAFSLLFAGFCLALPGLGFSFFSQEESKGSSEIRTERLVIVNSNGEEVGEFSAGNTECGEVHLRLGSRGFGITLHVIELEGDPTAMISLYSPDLTNTDERRGRLNISSVWGRQAVTLTGRSTSGQKQYVQIRPPSEENREVIVAELSDSEWAWPAEGDGGG